MSLPNTVKSARSKGCPSGSSRSFGLFTLMLLFVLVSGCASFKVARLPGPDEIASGPLKEIEAALTGEEMAESPEWRTGKVIRTEARADKLEAKATVLEAKAAVLAAELKVFSDIIDGTMPKLEALQNRANALEVDVEFEGDEASKKIEAIVRQAKDAAKTSREADKKAGKIGPKAWRARYKAEKARAKAVAAREKAEETLTMAEINLAKKYAAKLDKVLVEDIVAESDGADVLLLGEVHSNVQHHQFQLEVIKALVESGRKVAIGMEMFMVDSQDKLDEWVDGELGFEDFRVVYYINWKTPWAKYAPILKYAKEKEIDLVALSIERSAIKRIFVKPEPDTDPVAATDAATAAPSVKPEGELKGEAGASPDKEKTAQKETEVSIEGVGADGEITPEAKAQIEAEVEAEVEAAMMIEEEEEEEPSLLMTREEIEAIVCDVEPEYKRMIRDAIGEHAKDMNFDMDRFCRIQLVWDTAMAKSAKEYIEENPETMLVIIAGGMHAWKRGIPAQLVRLGSESIEELAEARLVANEAKAVAKEAKAAVKEAKELLSKAESVAARARRTAREASKAAGQDSSTGRKKESFMGVIAGSEASTQALLSPAELADVEAAADAGAAADVARHKAESAAERLKKLEGPYKEARSVAREATKRFKTLKKSRSEFRSLVVIPEMPEYGYFRSGGASTDDADYILLYQ